MLDCLVAAAADIEKASLRGFTALHGAAHGNSAAVIGRLLEVRANLERTWWGWGAFGGVNHGYMMLKHGNKVNSFLIYISGVLCWRSTVYYSTVVSSSMSIWILWMLEDNLGRKLTSERWERFERKLEAFRE